jgi:Rod binding domain-containing protein
MEPVTPASAAVSLDARQMATIEQKAQEFEALMLAEFLKPMFESAKAESLFGGDGAEQSIFGAMMQEKYAEAMAARGGIGIADQVKAELISIQSQNAMKEGTAS